MIWSWNFPRMCQILKVKVYSKSKKEISSKKITNRRLLQITMCHPQYEVELRNKVQIFILSGFWSITTKIKADTTQVYNKKFKLKATTFSLKWLFGGQLTLNLVWDKMG